MRQQADFQRLIGSACKQDLHEKLFRNLQLKYAYVYRSRRYAYCAAPRLIGGVQLAGTLGGGIGLGADLGWSSGAFSASLSGEAILGPGVQSDDDGEDPRRFGGLDSPRQRHR